MRLFQYMKGHERWVVNLDLVSQFEFAAKDKDGKNPVYLYYPGAKGEPMHLTDPELAELLERLGLPS